MERQRTYVLQELNIIGGTQYWYTIAKNDDLEILKQLKDLYKNKHIARIYQVIEVKY